MKIIGIILSGFTQALVPLLAAGQLPDEVIPVEALR